MKVQLGLGLGLTDIEVTSIALVQNIGPLMPLSLRGEEGLTLDSVEAGREVSLLSRPSVGHRLRVITLRPWQCR